MKESAEETAEKDPSLRPTKPVAETEKESDEKGRVEQRGRHKDESEPPVKALRKELKAVRAMEP